MTRSTAKATVMMSIGLIQVILVLCFIKPCKSDVCSQKICQCTKFGRSRVKVKCQVHGNVPTGIPSNTVELDLSSCSLSSITEDVFRNLTVLEKLDLSNNLLRQIPPNTFRNMKELEIINLYKNSISGGFHLPEGVSSLKISDNLLSIADAKVILNGLTRLKKLSMVGCNLQKIDDGTFRAMRYLQLLYLQRNELEIIGDGTLNRFKNLQKCWLANNKLTSVPDLTGPRTINSLRLQENQITDLSRIATSGIEHVYDLLLSSNKIDHLPPNIFQRTLVVGSLDLSFNKLQSLPDEIFNRLDQLNILVLTFNNITHINKRTFSGLASLTTLLLIRNNLTFIAKDVFYETPRLKSLFLHSNAITYIEKKTFNRLDLKQLTIFDNPLNSLPDGMFDEMANHTKVALTCKNLRMLPLGKYRCQIECTPPTSLHVILDSYQSGFRLCFTRSGFLCHDCGSHKKHSLKRPCANCSLCPVGTYMSTDENYCLQCPAGNKKKQLLHR